MEPKTFPGNETLIQAITISSELFGSVPARACPRNFYAPLHVSHNVDTVRIRVEAKDSRAALAVNGLALTGRRESEPIPLQVGRNIIQIRITAQDGTTERQSALAVFRAHPLPAWTRISERSPWLPRDSAGSLVFNNRMWLIGGYTPSPANDVWCSSDGLEWIQTGTIPTSKGVDIPIAFVFNGRMWVTDVEGNLFSSPDGVNWALVTERAPWKGRHTAGGVVFKGKILIMGGAMDDKLLNDIWSSPDGVQWKLETDCAPWSKRQLHSDHNLLELDDKLWLIGGGIFGSSYFPFQAYNDVWNSADGVHWEKIISNAAWSPRIWSSGLVYKNRLWLLSGFRSEPVWENLGDVWYSADGADWRQLTAAPTCRHSGALNVPFVVSNSIWAPRHESSAFVFRDAIWMVGGMVWPLMNDVWRLAIPACTFVSQPVCEGYQNALYSYPACADFNNSRTRISYRLIDAPAWLTVNPATGLISGIPAVVGSATVTLEAFDEAGETTRQTYKLHILPFNYPPFLA